MMVEELVIGKCGGPGDNIGKLGESVIGKCGGGRLIIGG
jgi:hypothetical protein